jgi:Fur family transcriptional regulator, ferric uptake regulator
MSSPSHTSPSPLKELTLEAIVDLLREQGMRITGSRLQILRCMLVAERPLSLDEIQEQCCHQDVSPDHATVFRVMNLLEKLKIAQKVNLNRSCSYFELLDPKQHYDHIVCTECGRITLMIDSCPVEKYERTIAKQYGYSELRHSLEFYGICPDCTEDS